MTRWLSRRRPVEGAAARLYCLPHSGGSAGEYLRWADALPGVEVWGVNLPGRGSRLDEAPHTDLATLVRALVEEVEFTHPFALFGHSFGALVAYEVAQRLRAGDRDQPGRLLLSGCPPPHIPRTAPRISDRPDAEFVDALSRRYGAETTGPLGDPELRALVLPGFRADLAALEGYAWPSHPPLNQPLRILSGDRDPLAGPRLAEWERHTTAGCRVRLLPGGHFYFRERPEAMAEAVLESLAVPTGPAGRPTGRPR